MRIRRLQLRDVRRYRELDIDLAPGLTVVRGPNEAGKSTIQRAIELALTRRVTSAPATSRRCGPGTPRADARPCGHRVRAGRRRTAGMATGTLEKALRGPEGHGRLEYDGQTHHRPGRSPTRSWPS